VNVPPTSSVVAAASAGADAARDLVQRIDTNVAHGLDGARNVSGLDELATNLLHLERVNYIGRTDELEMLEQMMRSHVRTGALIHGPAGTGKTALMTELAHATNTSVYALDVGALVSGTGLRGDLEARFSRIIADMNERGGILFIDEAHSLANVGKDKEGGTVGFLDYLKLRMTGGQFNFKVVLATDQPASFLADAGFKRRVMPVKLEPASRSTTDSIAGAMAVRHGVLNQVALSDAQQAYLLLRLRGERPTNLTPATIEIAIDSALVRASIRRERGFEQLAAANEPAYRALRALDEEQRTLLGFQNEYLRTSDPEQRAVLAVAIRQMQAGYAQLQASAHAIGVGDAAIDAVLHPLHREIDAAIAEALESTKPGSDNTARLVDMLGGPEGEAYSRAIVHKLFMGDLEVRRVMTSGGTPQDQRNLIETMVFKRLHSPGFVDGIKPMAPDELTPEEIGPYSMLLRDAMQNALSNRRLKGLVSNPHMPPR